MNKYTLTNRAVGATGAERTHTAHTMYKNKNGDDFELSCKHLP